MDILYFVIPFIALLGYLVYKGNKHAKSYYREVGNTYISKNVRILTYIKLFAKVFAGIFVGLAIVGFIFEYSWWAVAALVVVIVLFLLLCLLIEVGLRETCGSSLNEMAWVWKYFIERGFRPTGHQSEHPIQHPEHALKKGEVKVVLRLNAPLLKSHCSITTYFIGREYKEWTFPLDANHEEIFGVFDEYLKQENLL